MQMITRCLAAALALSVVAVAQAPTSPTFEKPVRLSAGGKPVLTEAPGYASPCWHDVTGDGLADLLVGQFADGKIRVYAGQKDGSLAEGQWLKAEAKVAKVPGVW